MQLGCCGRSKVGARNDVLHGDHPCALIVAVVKPVRHEITDLRATVLLHGSLGVGVTRCNGRERGVEFVAIAGEFQHLPARSCVNCLAIEGVWTCIDLPPGRVASVSQVGLGHVQIVEKISDKVVGDTVGIGAGRGFSVCRGKGMRRVLGCGAVLFDLFQGELRHQFRLAVIEDLEIVAPQRSHRATGVIANDNRHHHQVHSGCKSDRRFFGCDFSRGGFAGALGSKAGRSTA